MIRGFILFIEYKIDCAHISEAIGCITITSLPLNSKFILSRGVTINKVWISNRIYWTLIQHVATNNVDSLTELLTPNITVTTAHIKFLSLH
jgi:hypothetical protein